MRLLAPLAAAVLALSSSAAAAPPEPRRPAEIFVGLGTGNAVCDKEKPDSDCAVDKAGAAVSLGGAWRFHRHWAVGLELAIWGYNVRDSWKGKLADAATDVSISSSYVAPFARWYWFGKGSADAYLQLGLGLSGVKATAKNAGGEYEGNWSGVAVPIGIGAEWYVTRWLRLGPQALAYLHRSTRVCETANGRETCRDAGKDEALLAWRILVLSATVTFG
ncbi:MAG: hypothetical protein HYV09_04645 [Deltaproteobacteria bacterium]|nr:hypothetical protein [Deltaproteobacteria bacterium]